VGEHPNPTLSSRRHFLAARESGSPAGTPLRIAIDRQRAQLNLQRNPAEHSGIEASPTKQAISIRAWAEPERPEPSGSALGRGESRARDRDG
jgi:hypothetical protein